MLVVTGVFEDGRFIPDTPVSIPQKKKVTVTIEEKAVETVSNAARQKAFHSFLQYKGILPENFDYKKELSDYRDECHGHIA